MVTLTLSTLVVRTDGHHDAVGYCCCLLFRMATMALSVSCCPLPVFASYRWLHKHCRFLLLFVPMVTLTLSVSPWTSTLISRLIALVANGHLDSVGSLLYSAPMVVVTLSVLVVSWMATMALSTPVIRIAGSTGLSVCLFHTNGFKSTVGSPCSSLLFIQSNVASLCCRSYHGTLLVSSVGLRPSLSIVLLRRCLPAVKPISYISC
jgi:hypothetical protein